MRTFLCWCLSFILGVSLWGGLSQDGVRSHPVIVSDSIGVTPMGFGSSSLNVQRSPLGLGQASLQPRDLMIHDAQPYLVGRVYLPREGEMPYPTMILCHGVSSSKDTMVPLAIALAQRGIAAVVFDFGGYGESYSRSSTLEANVRDGQRMVDWVRQQQEFDADRLAIGGHSMGGTTALAIAMDDPTLKATVMLGIAGVATPRSPHNLFLGSGLYEELNPVGVINEFWQLATPANESHQQLAKSHSLSQQIGQIQAGTGRMLVFSPTADHLLAPYDARLIKAVTSWVGQSLQVNLAERQPQPPATLLWWRLFGQVLTGGTVLALLIYGYVRAYRWARSRRKLLWGMMMISTLAVLLLTHSIVGSNLGLMALVMTMVMGNYCCRDEMHQSCSMVAKVRVLLLYGGLVYLVFMVAVGFQALMSGSLLAYPQGIAYFPLLVLKMPVPLIYDRVTWLSYGMTSVYGVGLAGLAIGLEMMRPGWILIQAHRRLVQGVTWLRQPLMLQGQKPTHASHRASSYQTLGSVGLLLMILAIALVYQYRAGVLTLEATRFVLTLAAGFLVLPGLAVVVIVRSPRFLALEGVLLGWASRRGGSSW